MADQVWRDYSQIAAALLIASAALLALRAVVIQIRAFIFGRI